MSAREFGRRFGALLRERGYSARSFAERVNVSHTLIITICAGKKTPPVKRLESWFTILQLAGEARREMIDLGRSARAKGKRDSEEYIAGLEQRIEEMGKERDQLLRIIAAYEADADA